MDQWHEYELNAVKLFEESSVQFSCSVMCDSLWPHELHHARIPCPSPAPGACSNSCPSSWWYHPTISCSVVPFSSRLQPFSTSGSFQMTQVFTPKYWRFSFNISLSNEHSGLISVRMNWLDLLAVQGTLKSLLQHHSSKKVQQKVRVTIISFFLYFFFNLKFYIEVQLTCNIILVSGVQLSLFTDDSIHRKS